MIILGIVLLIIGSLTKIAIVGMIGIVALVVGRVLILSARSATRWVAAAITGDGARLGDRRHAGPAPQAVRKTLGGPGDEIDAGRKDHLPQDRGAVPAGRRGSLVWDG